MGSLIQLQYRRGVADDSGTWNTSVLVIGYRIGLTLPKAFAPMAFFFTLADIGPHHQASLFQ